ncbi:aminoglycoside phosphotransferase family protein [Paenibacillus urinalis]|uniref:aminoglycoside phosphotransferase family protein n=1 Tax=Paenibacillus urinalis TaxID=521520 RepID=UPI001961EAFA
MTQEEVLRGGNVNHIVRIGDTVRRPTGYWSSSVHELLRHLERQGFEGAPRFLGIDELGREILTFVTGDMNKPELESHTWWMDETLVDFAHLLRQFHDATQSFVPSPEAKWQLTGPDGAEHEVICHNDAAFYNLVFQYGKAAALIDFDMAGPGPRLWDIAYTLYTSVPLGRFTPDFSSETMELIQYQREKDAQERRRRIELFFESYGLPVPNNLKEWIIDRLVVLCDTIRNFAANGNQAFQKMMDEGHLAHYENEIQFIKKHYEDWI